MFRPVCVPPSWADLDSDLRGPRSPSSATWPEGGPLRPYTALSPPGPRQECLSRLFSPCGAVQSVELQEKPDLGDSPKEPKSKFFDPTPVPVSLRVLRSASMGARGAAGAVSPGCVAEVVLEWQF